MEALWLKSQGLPHHETCRLTDLSADTLRRYLQAYQEGGVERLKTLPFYRRQSALADHRPTIEAKFRARPPASVKKYCLYAKYHPDFEALKTAITQCLEQIHTVHEKAKSLGPNCTFPASHVYIWRGKSRVNCRHW